MRFRYRFENGKHLVRMRDDKGEWAKKCVEYATAAEAQAAARELDAMGPEELPAKPTKPAAPNPTEPQPLVTTPKPEADETDHPVPPREEWDIDPHDFTVIPGVGKVTAEKLHENKITTLKQLARVSASRAEELGIKEEWIEEAKRLTQD